MACFTQPHWCPHAFLLSPAVSVQVWPKATVQEGQLVNLTCLVWSTRLAQLTYTWYKDGQQHPGARSILLPNVTVMDAASYRCSVVTPGQAPHLSRPVILDILCECGWLQGGARKNDSSLQGSGHGQSPTGVHWELCTGIHPTDGALHKEHESSGGQGYGIRPLWAEQQCLRLGKWRPFG